MKTESETAARTLRQFRASVTTRRKLASLRVSSQRRRVRRIGQLYTADGPAKIAGSLAESRMGRTNSR
jgi:hypothetical protein